jgi:hypothetical protein
MRVFKAVIVGTIGAVVATSLGSVFYALIPRGPVTWGDIGFVIFIALSGWPRLVLVGSFVGLLWALLLPRATLSARPVVAVVVATLLGAAVGYSYAHGSIHVSPKYASLSVAAARVFVASLALLFERIRGRAHG